MVRLTDGLVGQLSDHLGLPRKSVVKLTDCLIGQLSVTGERMDTEYWLTT